MRRLRLLLLLPLLVLDCVGNCLIGGSFKNTISAEAYHARNHKWWGWTHRVIDALFFWQTNHCQRQALHEYVHGSVWAAWMQGWRNG